MAEKYRPSRGSSGAVDPATCAGAAHYTGNPCGAKGLATLAATSMRPKVGEWKRPDGTLPTPAGPDRNTLTQQGERL